MNPDELAKYGTEIGKLSVALGFTDCVRRMLGPAADEVGELLRDRVKLYRYGKQIKFLEKFERMAKEAGFTPQAVPPKILFPLLEGASFEENEVLHTMWAALLANAASPDNGDKARPGFIATLRQMAPDEAALLNWIYDRVAPGDHCGLPLQSLYADLRFSANLDEAETKLRVCLGGLESAGLLSTINIYGPAPYSFTFISVNETSNFSTSFPLFLPPRGLEFVRACRPPKPKENG